MLGTSFNLLPYVDHSDESGMKKGNFQIAFFTTFVISKL